MRTEKDIIGKKEIPKGALYGINSVRATENFPIKNTFSKEWYKAIGLVKLSVYLTYKDFYKEAKKRYDIEKLSIKFMDEDKIDKLIETAKEVAEGKYFEEFIIPATSGGAGTSINMNVNEIIANATIQKDGGLLGDYSKIHPIEDCNIYQSTNDVIPTSLKIAILRLLENLEEEINALRSEIEKKEDENKNVIRIAYTQMQEAVPSSFGKLFSAYNDALSRDWWRVSKAFERIKEVNLGGSAVGTGITVPTFVILEVVKKLQELSNLPISKSENLSDTTSNLDSFVELHSIIKTNAVNLEKMSRDIRLMASDIAGDNRYFFLEKKQVGSSIMPSKVNPVITEFIISSAARIYSNDELITRLSAQGNIDLNAYIPIIGHSIIESLNLLIAMNQSIKTNLIKGLKINKKSTDNLYKCPAITTALVAYIGYKKAEIIAKEMTKSNKTIFEANDELKLIDTDKLKKIMKQENLLKLGFRLDDLLK